MGFEIVKSLYLKDPHFAPIFRECEELDKDRWLMDRDSPSYSKFDGFLYKERRLCVPSSSWWELFGREAHGGLMGHFVVEKRHKILEEQFYLPKMRKDVTKVCDQFMDCRSAKSFLLPQVLYTLLPTPLRPWLDISMYFKLGLPSTKKR